MTIVRQGNTAGSLPSCVRALWISILAGEGSALHFAPSVMTAAARGFDVELWINQVSLQIENHWDGSGWISTDILKLFPR